MAHNDLPEELTFSSISNKKHVIISKQQRQILPTTNNIVTVTANSSTQTVFRIPIDDAYSIDFNSAWVTCDMQITGLDATTISANAPESFQTISWNTNCSN